MLWGMHSHLRLQTISNKNTRSIFRQLSTFLVQLPISEETICSEEDIDDVIANRLDPYFLDQRPVVFRKVYAQVPAIERWKNWDYIENAVDCNSPCHVEVGGNYSQSERCDMRFGDYLAYLRLFEEKYGRKGPNSPPDEELFYLAQNDVIGGLDSDYKIPSALTKLGIGSIYNMMMWLGPYGCISPFHYDPLDNLFMQFVGEKRVILFPPGTHMYAGHNGAQSNTSLIDPSAALDLSLYPKLKDLPAAEECTLFPGDMLFIPKKWWHHVTTLKTSISINAWWR